MRTKIALIVALASFLAIAAMGTALAGAEPVAESTPVETTSTTTTAIPSLQAPACANGVDDDADGLLDSADPDCESPEDASEAPSAAAAEPTPAPAPAPEPEPNPADEGGSSGVHHGTAIDG